MISHCATEINCNKLEDILEKVFGRGKVTIAITPLFVDYEKLETKNGAIVVTHIFTDNEGNTRNEEPYSMVFDKTEVDDPLSLLIEGLLRSSLKDYVNNVVNKTLKQAAAIEGKDDTKVLEEGNEQE